MARKFNITDIVALKGDMETLFMVVNYSDYSGLAPNGKEIEDIDYELMQIYPVQAISTFTILGQPDLEIKEKRGSKNHELVLSFVQKDREKQGWFGMPDFLRVANQNLKTIEGSRVKEVKPPMRKLDEIRYDQLESIDQCLQAISDLNALHEMFGDEAYLQLKEVVTARIIRLNK